MVDADAGLTPAQSADPVIVAAQKVAADVVAEAILRGPYRDVWSGNAETDRAWRGL